MILFAPTNDRTLETSLMMKSFQILIILHIFSKVQVRLMVDQCNARGSVGEWSKIGKTWQMDLCCPNLQCDREGHLNLFIYGPNIFRSIQPAWEQAVLWAAQVLSVLSSIIWAAQVLSWRDGFLCLPPCPTSSQICISNSVQCALFWSNSLSTHIMQMPSWAQMRNCKKGKARWLSTDWNATTWWSNTNRRWENASTYFRKVWYMGSDMILWTGAPGWPQFVLTPVSGEREKADYNGGTQTPFDPQLHI